MSVTFFALSDSIVNPDVAGATSAGDGAVELEINVNNGNAGVLLAVLGLRADPNGDLCGELAPSDFLGRVLLAQAISPADAGVPAYAVGWNVVECGRRVGYVQQRLEEMRDLAEFCASNGRLVVWS